MVEPPAAYHQLDPPLRDLLERSFADRVAGRPGAESNLANAWWSPGAPTTTWEALARIGPAGVNVVVRIYERVAALDPSLGLWRAMRWLRNVWWGGSAGFKVVWEDPAAARDTLDALFPSVARDTFVGSLEHQLRSPLALLAAWPLARWRGRAHAHDLADAVTYREVTALGAESVHFCVGRRTPRDPALDDVHLDWHSPVRGLDHAARRCAYARHEGARHWLQAMRGLGAPRLAFDVVDALMGSLDHADLAARWAEARWDLALRGAEGHARAVAYRWEAEELLLSTPSTASA